MSIEEKIRESFLSVLEQTDSTLTCKELQYDTILLESGLDSLGFAILVATLEEELDLDPFSTNETPIYPKTYGEFVAIYEK